MTFIMETGFKFLFRAYLLFQDRVHRPLTCHVTSLLDLHCLGGLNPSLLPIKTRHTLFSQTLFASF